MAYREVQLRCPRCRTPLAGKRENACCDTCGGVWMDLHNLRDLYETDGRKRLPELEEFPDGSPQLLCAVCELPMVHLFLDVISIESCPEEHGLWLGEGVFEKVIAHAKLGPKVTITDLGFAHVPKDKTRSGGS